MKIHTPLVYLVDGVITVSNQVKNNNLLRVLEIVKARRTRISCTSALFSLSEGIFNLCSPFTSTAPPILIPPTPIPDLDDDHISIGCLEFDDFIKDGLTVGDTYLFSFAQEARDARGLLEVMFTTNHLNLGRKLKRLAIPDRYMNFNSVLLNGVVERLELLKFRIPRESKEMGTNVLPSNPRELINELENELKENDNSNGPLVYLVDVDLILNIYGTDSAKVIFSEISSLVRTYRGVFLALKTVSEKLEEPIFLYPNKAFSIEIVHRSLLIRGVIPEKNYFNLVFKTNTGSISIGLKEII